tara:strand:- start:1748 stop:2365 length:618 start_codon:yes stop_codon:yes gene_type:complete
MRDLDEFNYVISIAPASSKEKTQSYIDWVVKHNFSYKILTTLDDIIEGGLLLCGGADVGTKPKRDTFELQLTEQAFMRRLPILGICRGMQLVNIYLGGVVEDLKVEGDHCPSLLVKGETKTHNLRSLYHEVYDKEGNEFMINSRHHQHCKELGKGLEKILWAYDDTIEAAIGEKVVLVQWHPERKELWDNKQASEMPITLFKKQY